MHIGLRLVDLNNYLDIVYWFKIRYSVCVCSRLVDLNNYFYDVFLTKNRLKKSMWKNDSNSKYSYHGHIFKTQKIRKKGYMEMIKKFYLET